MVINTVGPTWEGNQVWFIVGGAGLFAAWPFAYAISFSGFYLAMFVVLAAMILRPVSFKYRSKRPHPKLAGVLGLGLFVGGFVPVLVFGVALGNVLQGAPFRLNSDLRAFYDGSFIGLFSPFALLCGLLSVSMLVLHGAAWLTVKAEDGPVTERARGSARSPAWPASCCSRPAASGWRSAAWASGSKAWPTPPGRPTRCAARPPCMPRAPGSTTTAAMAG
jgi:cytochrome d ubiquinol oxidase subunit II